MPTSYETPGVYINELNAFPNSVAAVATAIPAFVGYTPEAFYNGKSYLNKAVRIESFPQFMTYFGRRDPSGQNFLSENDQYRPLYSLVDVPEGERSKADLVLGAKAYYVKPQPNTAFHLYNCIKLFYANGGGTCYVVSVGQYPNPPVEGGEATQPLLNGSIKIKELTDGLALIAAEDEPTMIVVPDAVLLDQDSNGGFNQAVLKQCSELKSRIGLFDVWGGDDPDPLKRNDIIKEFRTRLGMRGLSYGVAYFPFLKTSVMSGSTIDYRNVGVDRLKAVLTDAGDTAAVDLLNRVPAQPPAPDDDKAMRPDQIESALLNVSRNYAKLHEALLARMNILPPSAALAGIYTAVDNEEGVWHAPANTTINQAADTTLKISHDEQKNLNVDPNDGKSINAIRLFPGKGVTVWGARTLDGNSDDWRYINVRRTLIFIEQSIKVAANAYVFEPNTANTWSLMTSMLNNFLHNLWSQGALVGATPADAFSVSIGLGLTMTPQDILEGKLIISVKVAVSRPAEFIIINIQQQMQTS